MEHIRETFARRERLEDDEEHNANGISNKRLVFGLGLNIDQRLREMRLEWLLRLVRRTRRMFRLIRATPVV
jgi:hypothetical protein